MGIQKYYKNVLIMNYYNMPALVLSFFIFIIKFN
jgi:hypothetical protein